MESEALGTRFSREAFGLDILGQKLEQMVVVAVLIDVRRKSEGR
jgi:hypothetical protein